MAKETMIILRATDKDKEVLQYVQKRSKDKSMSATVLRLVYEAYEKVKQS